MSRRERVSLYVRHISDSTRPDDLRYVFEKYGAVRDIYIPMDYYTRRPRGFAYVEFEDGRDAEEAMRELDGYRMHGRELEIEFAQGDRKSAGQMRGKYGAPSRGYDDRDRDRYSRRSPRRRSRSRSVERDRNRSSRRRRSPSRSRSRSRSRDKDRERRPKRRRSSEDRRKSRSRSRSQSKERKEESRSRSGSPAGGDGEENGKNHSKSEENGGDEYEEETAD